MNDEHIDEKTKAAVAKFQAMDWYQTFSANQDSFETFTLTVRNGLRGELGEILPEMGDLPFSHVNTILVVTGFGAVREGARGFASLTEGRCTFQPVPQIDFGTLWEAAAALSNPANEYFAGLRKTIEQIPEIDGVLGTAQASLLSNLTKKFPVLNGHEQELGQILLANLLNGVRLEYLYPLLIERQRAEEKLLRQLVDKADVADPDKEQALARLKRKLGINDAARPWPMDLKCVCGQNLAEQRICCDTDELLSPAIFPEDLTPNFMLKCASCGAALTGFRCEACARYYTWTRGTVPSVADH